MTSKPRAEEELLWSEDAEQALLGAMMQNDTVIGFIADNVAPDDFWLPSHGKLYALMVEMHAAGQPIDTVTVYDHDKSLDRDYLHTLYESCPVATNAESYKDIIVDFSLRRKLKRAGEAIIKASIEQEADEASAIADLAVHQAISRPIQDAPVSMHELAVCGYDRIEQASKGVSRYHVSTPLKTLDEVIGGFEEGEFVVVAARPSQGKTALALNMLRGVSEEHDTLLFSAEMTKNEIFDRMVCTEATVSLTNYRAGKLTQEEVNLLVDVLPTLDRLQLTVDDKAVSIPQIQRKVRRAASSGNLAVVAIDYIQLITLGMFSESSTQEVTAISRALKLMAKEHNITVLGLSQLNRPPKEASEDRRPQLSDLRQSGAIEQDADAVIFIYSKEEDGPYIKRLYVAKNRNGPTGEIRVRWEPLWTLFEDL